MDFVRAHCCIVYMLMIDSLFILYEFVLLCFVYKNKMGEPLCVCVCSRFVKNCVDCWGYCLFVDDIGLCVDGVLFVMCVCLFVYVLCYLMVFMRHIY